MAIAVQAERTWYLNRWNQLILGVIAMMAISSPQYVWTLFTGPLNQKLGTTLPQLQWTFSLLIILQTWLSPFQAYLVDRFGPRLLIAIGALLSGGSWVLSPGSIISGRSISPMACSAASAPASSMSASSG
jgi:MFS family permease